MAWRLHPRACSGIQWPFGTFKWGWGVIWRGVERLSIHSQQVDSLFDKAKLAFKHGLVPRKRHSFTVLELVFAVAITSLLTLATLRICGQSLDVVDTLVDAHSLHNEAEKAFNYLEADLKNLSLRHEGEYAEAVMEYAPDSIAHKMKNENGEEVTDNYSNRGLYLISQVARQDGKLRKALVHYRLLRRGGAVAKSYVLGLSRSVLGSNAFVQHNGKGGIPQTGIGTRLFLNPSGDEAYRYIRSASTPTAEFKGQAALAYKVVSAEGSLSLKGRLNSQEAFSKIAGIPQQTVYSQRQNKRVPFNQTWFEDTENIVASNVLNLEIVPVISAGYLGLEEFLLDENAGTDRWMILSACENAEGNGPAFLAGWRDSAGDVSSLPVFDYVESHLLGTSTLPTQVGLVALLKVAENVQWIYAGTHELSPMKYATATWQKQQTYNLIWPIKRISYFKVKLTLVSAEHIQLLDNPHFKMDFETFKRVYGVTFYKNILAQR